MRQPKKAKSAKESLCAIPASEISEWLATLPLVPLHGEERA